MLSTNQIAWFLNQLYLRNKMMKFRFFACRCKNMRINCWLNILREGMVKDGCGHSGHRTLKLAVSQEWMDGINWFSACWYKLRKAKFNFSHFWLGVVRNGHGLLCHRTLNSAISQEWIDQLGWFIHADSDAIIYGQVTITTLHIWPLNTGAHCSCIC